MNSNNSKQSTLSKISENMLESQEKLKILIADSPLYSKINFDDNIPNAISQLYRAALRADIYCTKCTAIMPHRRILSIGGGAGTIALNNPSAPEFFNITMKCLRCDGNSIFILKNSGYTLEKIGQHPTYADIIGPDLIDLSKIASKENLSELRKAIGLASHDASIAAFVYLRRIFERMIDESRARHEQAHGKIENFFGLDMSEKIDRIKDSLPAEIHQNKETWSILSAGIHSLSEKQCAKYFAPLKTAIAIMMRAEYEKRQKFKESREMQKSIKALARDLKGSANE